jgi:hypothetical protein
MVAALVQFNEAALVVLSPAPQEGLLAQADSWFGTTPPESSHEGSRRTLAEFSSPRSPW